MPRLSRDQVLRACASAARATRFSPPPKEAQLALPDELVAPLRGVTALAWTNGQTFFAPITPVPVRSAHPRSRLVRLDSTSRAH